MKIPSFFKTISATFKNFATFCCIIFFIMFLTLVIATVFGLFEQNKILDYIFKFKFDGNLINVIATCISALAAIYSYRAAKNSADIAEKSLHHNKLKDMLETRDAVRKIWFFLNKKITNLNYNPEDPNKFLITKGELDSLEEHYYNIHHSSVLYGKEIHKEIRDFYLNLKNELKTQSVDNCFDDKAAWLDYRKAQTEYAFKLITQCEDEIFKNL